MKTRALSRLLPLLLAAFLIPVEAAAADHYNLEEGLSTELTDNIPVSYRNTEVQAFSRWEHTADGEEGFQVVPRLEYGLWLNTQLSLEAPYEFGEAVEENEFKTVGVELFYNFNQEGLFLPAIALAGKGDFPVGDEEDGLDTTLKLILSRTVGRSAQWQRLHLNAAWKHNSEARDGEREDLYKLVLGYDRRMNADTILILDYVREEEMEKDREINLVEAGLRYQCTPLTVFSAGAGAGFGEDSPDFRLTLAFQHSFNAWFFGGR